MYKYTIAGTFNLSGGYIGAGLTGDKEARIIVFAEKWKPYLKTNAEFNIITSQKHKDPIAYAFGNQLYFEKTLVSFTYARKIFDELGDGSAKKTDKTEFKKAVVKAMLARRIFPRLSWVKNTMALDRENRR